MLAVIIKTNNVWSIVCSLSFVLFVLHLVSTFADTAVSNAFETQRVEIKKREGVSRILHDVRTYKSPLLFQKIGMSFCHTDQMMFGKKIYFFPIFVFFLFLSSTLLYSSSCRYLSLSFSLLLSPTSLTFLVDSFSSSPKMYF